MKMNCSTTHFIGIGGSGMSGIAKILLQKGYRVSGSDLRKSSFTDGLVKLGAKVTIGHSRENIGPEVGLVVVSTAIPKSNPELLEAESRGVEIISRGKMLARLMEDYKGITVAGAHGKTTTTSMIAQCLEINNYDPTIIIGGELNDIGSNAKLGGGQYFVTEADESDGSFLKLHPHMAVVSNVENDHLDFYGTMENITAAFEKHIHSVIPNGCAILCMDDPFLREMANSGLNGIITYGFHPSADYNLRIRDIEGFSSICEVSHGKKRLGLMELKVPGKHNMVNALASIAVCHQMGIDFEGIAHALSLYTGVRRRFQVVGDVHNTFIIDDYAHHPTEIMAALNAARQVEPRRVIAVFQPHRYTRTKFLHREFGRAFGDADMVIINDIYGAGEKPMEGVSSEIIVESIKSNSNKNVLLISQQTDTVKYLKKCMESGDLVITLGAGDVWKIGQKLLKGTWDDECSQEVPVGEG
ncbi:MAG: UDP-N-acetylmuramate--L-alanine ligase [Clostridia bacterium]|nr:UDP-N-acetylmuramate--L-alanine ligase [Clostridia bacterium]